MKQFDFRSMSFYQIWIRSFCDGNGDGIGDLFGVYDKLDYIRSLGVDGIWFSPIYPSPNADYGYDISDYKNIHPDYGDLDQFKKVLEKAHSLGLKVLLDLVINHTSDEHPWFLESRKGKDNPYSDYYIWRDPRLKRQKKRPPNNWFSQFEGLAWEYDKNREQYYLHVFAKKQPDLNMDNPRVREEVKSIMRFWLDMGVDGFREDVITYISKHPQLPDGIPFLPAINGLPYYKDGPNLVPYLREFREVAKEYGAVQIGEAPMTPVKTALRYLSGKDRVLDLMIQFDVMMADCFFTEYVHHRFQPKKLKRAFSKWQYQLAGKAWNALYLENHDHPRVISRYGSERYWRESGTMLAACFLFQQGTPFIYQGQEIGMTNIRLSSIDQYLDVASIYAYHHFHTHEPQKKRMLRIHISSRDSARTPMQWDESKYAGFSKVSSRARADVASAADGVKNTGPSAGHDGNSSENCRSDEKDASKSKGSSASREETGTVKPWFFVNPNYRKINVAREEKDPDSILNFYRRCLALRKSSKALLRGTYREFAKGSRFLYLYERRLKGERILVLCSFSDQVRKYRLPRGYEEKKAQLLLCNYAENGAAGILRPYETRVFRWR